MSTACLYSDAMDGKSDDDSDHDIGKTSNVNIVNDRSHDASVYM